jgi:hypothetical protein
MNEDAAAGVQYRMHITLGRRSVAGISQATPLIGSLPCDGSWDWDICFDVIDDPDSMLVLAELSRIDELPGLKPGWLILPSQNSGGHMRIPGSVDRLFLGALISTVIGGELQQAIEILKQVSAQVCGAEALRDAEQLDDAPPSPDPRIPRLDVRFEKNGVVVDSLSREGLAHPEFRAAMRRHKITDDEVALVIVKLTSKYIGAPGTPALLLAIKKELSHLFSCILNGELFWRIQNSMKN